MIRPTHVIFQLDDISFVNENENRKVKATKFIKKGTLLCVEHLFKGDIVRVQTLIERSPNIYNALFPRKDKWNAEQTDSQKQQSRVKTTLNCIKEKEDDTLFFGETLSKFNHACDANSSLTTLTTLIVGVYELFIISIVATKDIGEDDEIYINYGNNIGHEPEFKQYTSYSCNCSMSFEERRAKAVEKKNFATSALTKSKNNIYVESLRKYLESTNAIHVTLCQELCAKGIYISPDLVTITPKMQNFIKKHNLPDCPQSYHNYMALVFEQISEQFHCLELEWM